MYFTALRLVQNYNDQKKNHYVANLVSKVILCRKRESAKKHLMFNNT